MLWLSLAGTAPTSVTPVDSAAASITGYILGFGPLGIAALAMAWLLFRGWRMTSPAGEERIRAAAREEARADLVAERDRILEDKHRIEAERDEALRIARDQLTPLLQSFVATTSTLVPLLQDLVLSREALPRRRRGAPDP